MCWLCEERLDLGLDMNETGEAGVARGRSGAPGLRVLSVYVEADSWGRVITPAPKIFKYTVSEKSGKIGYA